MRRISVQEEGRHVWGVGKKAEGRVYGSSRIELGPGVKGRILRSGEREHSQWKELSREAVT